MKTIGTYLKLAREEKGISRGDLGKETKIRKEFIEAIESENWGKLPDFPVVSGFVKSLAGALELNVDQMMAFLRRDYPPQEIKINPKPYVLSDFRWRPKLAFTTVILLFVIMIGSYLVIQYLKFVTPPSLTISEPKQEQIVKKSEVFVSGKTDPEATVKINNQPVLVNEDGTFSATIPIVAETSQIEVVASSRSGKVTKVTVKIKPR